MPPLKKGSVKVSNTQQSCRVCLSDNPVMLELFGSECQSVPYAEDINKCLSVEVKKGDGLPSKICIKCAGVLGEYRVFVDKTLAAESERSSKCDSTSGSSTSCYYCLTSGNILFPVPEASIIKTKDCLGFEVTTKDQICVRCQFHLEGLHELKLKACAALKHFVSSSLSVQKKFSPAKDKEKDKEKEQSVKDIVDCLKDKFNVEKSKPERKMDVKKIDVKPVSVCLLDISRMFDDEFLKGTISASKVLERLHNSLHINGHVSVEVSSSKSPKQHSSKKVNEPIIKEKIFISTKNDKQLTLKKTPKSQPEKKSRRLSKTEDQTESDVADDKPAVKSDNVALEVRKRGRESSEPETEILSKKSRRRSESERSESEKSVADSSQEKLDKISSEKKTEVFGKEEDQHLKESTILNDELALEKKKGSKKSRLKKDKMECESSTDILQKPSHPSIVRPTADSSSTENGLTSESTKQRRRMKKVEFAVDHEADDDEEDLKIGIKRKRKLSEDDENFSPKGKGKAKKKVRQHNGSDEDDDLDESHSKKIELDQPEFLKDMDELLKSTPKSTFKPFICSVCHEGYISTVKGKLHKLIVHDPHANVVLKLMRCDDYKNAIEADNLGRDPQAKIKIEIESDAQEVDGTSRPGADNVTETAGGRLGADSDANEAETTQRIDSEETDDLFNDSEKRCEPVTGKNSEDLFNSLFGGSKTVESDSTEKVCVVAEKIVKENLDESNKSDKDKDSVECDPLNMVDEKETETESVKPVEEEKSEEECEEPAGEEISEVENEKHTGGSSKPESEKSTEEETSKSESKVATDEEKSSKSESKVAIVEEKSSKSESKVATDEEKSSKSESIVAIDEEKSSKSESTVAIDEEKSEVDMDEVKKPEPEQTSEKSEVDMDEVKKSEPEKTSDVETPVPKTGNEVQEPEEGCADGQSSDEIQEGEDTHKDSESNQREVPDSEISKPTDPAQKMGEVDQVDNEEAVSSSLGEDKLPDPAPMEERQEGHGNKDSEADLASSCSPKRVENDDDKSVDPQVEQIKDIVDAVDSTTATVEIHHGEVKEGNLPTSSCVMPDSSAEDCEGIIVGDD